MSDSLAMQPRGTAPQHLALTSPTARLAKAARDGNPQELAFEAAVRLVSDAFIKPILAQVRSSSDMMKPFAPGSAEKAFRPLLDGELSDRIARSENFDLVQATQRSLLTKAFRQQATPATQPMLEARG